MILILWVILFSLIQTSHARNVMRSLSTKGLKPRHVRNNKEDVKNANVLKALSILLSETEMLRPLQQPTRARKGRQLLPDSLAGFQQEEVCEQTGFEMRKREECNEVFETECTPIEVTKFRKEIVSKCKTKSDQSCNITMREVPRQECKATKEKRCDTEYRVVEDTLYNEECKVDVQHICEEHIKVPVNEPEYHPPQEQYPPSVPHYTPAHYPTHQAHYHTPHSYGSQPASDTTMYRPHTPHTPPPHYPLQPIYKLRQHRRKRDDNFLGISDPSLRPVSYGINNMDEDKKLTDIVRQIMLEVIEKDQSLGEVNATIKHPEASDLYFHLPLPKQSLTSKQENKSEADLPPVISIHELPAPYGCRSIATKMCYKVPMVVPRKVPYEKCKDVPSVDCAIVLKKVPELECVPKLFEECKDVAQEIPYLAPDEECEEVPYEDCVEIEEKIPVELCKRIRLDDEAIFLNRGPIFRKEGAKRRNPVRG